MMLDILAAAIVRANERLDWIEQRDGRLPDDNYATIETTVGLVRALRGEPANATQTEDLQAAWERFNTSTVALIESASGEYVEQRNRAVESAEQAHKREDVADAKLAASEQRAADLVERIRDALDCLPRALDGSQPFSMCQRAEVMLAIEALRKALAAAAPSAATEGA